MKLSEAISAVAWYQLFDQLILKHCILFIYYKFTIFLRKLQRKAILVSI